MKTRMDHQQTISLRIDRFEHGLVDKVLISCPYLDVQPYILLTGAATLPVRSAHQGGSFYCPPSHERAL